MKAAHVALALMVCLVACARTPASGDPAAAAAPTTSVAPPEIAALAGTYGLVLIDGHAPPFAPNHPGRPADAPPLEVLASTLRVSPNGGLVMAMSYRVRADGAERFFDAPFTGTCVPGASGLTIQWDGAGRTPLTVRGDTLLYDNEGMLFAYRRRR